MGTTTGIDMQTAGTVTRFATRILGVLATGLKFRVVSRLEITGNLIVTVGAGLGTDEGRPRDIRRSHDGVIESSAGDQPRHERRASEGTPEKLGPTALKASSEK
jgi:hypothetical protein